MLGPVLYSLWDIKKTDPGGGRQRWGPGRLSGISHLSSLPQKAAWTSSPGLRPVLATKCTSVMKEPSTVSLPLKRVKVASSVLILIAKPGEVWKQYISLRGRKATLVHAARGRWRAEGRYTRQARPLWPRKSARPPRAKDRCGSLVPSTGKRVQSDASVRRR